MAGVSSFTGRDRTPGEAYLTKEIRKQATARLVATKYGVNADDYELRLTSNDPESWAAIGADNYAERPIDTKAQWAGSGLNG